jgi:hypothetical protein
VLLLRFPERVYWAHLLLKDQEQYGTADALLWFQLHVAMNVEMKDSLSDKHV